MKKVLKSIFKKFAGYKIFYPVYETLFYIGVMGMNYGNGGDASVSGEKATIQYIKKRLKSKRPVVIDGGANFGKYTQLILDTIPDAKIVSFEPSVSYFESLNNNLKDRPVTLVNKGLGAENEQLTLYKYEDRPGLASVFNRNLDHYAIKPDGEETISIIRLDDYCEQERIDHIDLLKLDIEGNELFALQGANQLLRSGKIHYIQFEFGGSNIDSKTYFRDFWTLLHQDYRIYRILKNGLGEIKHYNEYQELFANINFLAERKN